MLLNWPSDDDKVPIIPLTWLKVQVQFAKMCVRYFIGALIVILGIAHVNPEGIPSPIYSSPFINNGPEAQIENFPFFTSIRRNALHVGGGAIVSANWAITTAHILLGCPPTQVSVRAGSDERLLGGFLHNAQMIELHENFNPINLDNNVGLIRVLEPFIFSSTVRAVSLDVQGKSLAIAYYKTLS